jgi:rod shape-determining protein MreB
LLVGERVAEDMKIQVGRMMESGEELALRMRGRDLMTGLPKEVIVSSEQVIHALQRSIMAIIEGITSTLEITPPELVADIYQRGMILAGGGALLMGLDKIIAKATGIPVKIIEDSLTCAVRGMGLILEDENLLKEVAIPSSTQEEKSSR